jgi:hypothetical protein
MRQLPGPGFVEGIESPETSVKNVPGLATCDVALTVTPFTGVSAAVKVPLPSASHQIFPWT